MADDRDIPTLDHPERLTDADWQERLAPDAYRVLRRAGTERAFTGMYWNTKTPGTYHCGGCGVPLFRSDHKYDSGCGWPSFTQALEAGVVATKEDRSFHMVRTEVLCARCEGHLGHVFPDGPPPSGLRYCINSLSLAFRPDDA